MTASRTDNPLRAALKPGAVVSKKYRIGRLLGSGAASVVVEAQHMQNGQRYALKLVDPEVVRLRGGAKRLVNEIRTVAQLTSAHAVRVFAVGALESGEPYVVMEYINGVHLGTLLQQTGPMWVTAATDAVLEACDAVASAHAVGIIHGGLKPENLFVAERPDGGRTIKVADFGVGFIVRNPQSSGEREAVSFVHSAPEQILGQPIDERTDVWSIGVLLYEIIAGRPPFSVRRLTELVSNTARNVAPRPLQSPHGQIPPQLVNIIERCLVLDPSRRWQSVYDLAEKLAPFASPDKRESWMATRVARESLPPASARKSAHVVYDDQARTTMLRDEDQRQTRIEDTALAERISWSEMPTQQRPDDRNDQEATRLHNSGESMGPPPLAPGQELLVAEVIPPSHVKNAIIAVVALMILLVLPLMYLHTLAKKTEFGRAAPSASGSEAAPMQEFTFEPQKPQPPAPKPTRPAQ
jgi:serine/threonine-protein kinase